MEAAPQCQLQGYCLLAVVLDRKSTRSWRALHMAMTQASILLVVYSAIMQESIFKRYELCHSQVSKYLNNLIDSSG